MTNEGRPSRTVNADLGWPDDWIARVSGEACSMCAVGRPDDDGYGLRILKARYSDAYLQRARVLTGYTKVIWRGRHVVEPTELRDEEAAGYWREVLLVAQALQRHYRPLKMNYETLGNVVPHLHTHLMPRYTLDPAPGQPFPLPVDVDSIPAIPEEELRREALILRSILAQSQPS